MSRLKLGVAVVLAALLAGIPAADVQAKPATAQADSGSSVALAILKEIGVGAAQGVGTQGLAQVFSVMGIGGGPGTAAQLANIQQSLERVSTQLASLRNQTAGISRDVAGSNYNNAAREALPILNAVDHAEAKLKSAAAQPVGSKDQKTLATEARSYVGANLLDKGTLLATLVSGSTPFAPDSILAAAWKVRTQNNFLTPSTSVQLRYLVDYYTAYEAALTQVVAGYYRSAPGYPLSEIQHIVNQTDSTVTDQLNQRRDAVPDGTVVDVRTGLMWYTKSVPVTMNPAGDTVGAEYDGVPGDWFLGNPTLKAQPDGLRGWTFPTKDQLLSLINGWSGQPSAWLMKNAGFPASLVADAGSERNSEFWTSTPNVVTQSGLQRITSYIASFAVVNMLGGELAWRAPGGSTNQHGYIPVRLTLPGSYLR